MLYNAFDIGKENGDLNDKCFTEMKALAAQYLQCAYLKEETYGLLPFDVREKALEMEKKSTQK